MMIKTMSNYNKSFERSLPSRPGYNPGQQNNLVLSEVNVYRMSIFLEIVE